MSADPQSSMSLLRFLKQASHYASSQTRQNQVTYVLGNPSADLDSIISAILFSYFASSSKILQRANPVSRQYVPIINLHDVPSGRELARLRPEFVTALKLSTNEGEDGERWLLKENILTIADLRQRLHHNRLGSDTPRDMDVFMVDWNALPVMASGIRGIEGISAAHNDDDDDIRISVNGCIDHHDDEKFVSPDVGMRCIQTGVGSCTSLVVRELRSLGLWKDSPVPAQNEMVKDAASPQFNDGPALIYESQAAKLALAAILADTTNMTNKDKVSDVDRVAVSFLENKIKQTQDRSWSRDEFFQQIIEAKNSSVDRLTIDEVLGRDYKDWIDQLPAAGGSPGDIKIGICSVVKPLSWLVSKAEQEDGKSNSSQPFFDALHGFSRTRNLDVVAIMTAYALQPENKFNREFLLWVLNPVHLQGLENFELLAVDELQLQKCSSVDIQTHSTMDQASIRIWNQMDVSKSRKRVAPLLRNVMARKLE
ncbi:exopolyphosphatase [Coccidioides immitis RS]|uniref:Exopolyphosphatase n=2 Tax=Coccidioides immitis TaxID=5501 RepID=J3K8D8_COCIM|nr:exopolyphosphatase [Coccidioides immitis RS]EAS31075.3 exopolyphosphatase [Coccidioides immitis RS]KMU74647.1 hypothetical protein CISG_00577 [Coccidioides immitis RMSCC 3703]TPX23926.1 Exopolyphosphatase [Coccidioides immitis]